MLTAASAPASTVAGNQRSEAWEMQGEERVAVRGAPVRRRGGRGGRTPRPAATVPATPATVDIDLTETRQEKSLLLLIC